MSFGQYGQHNYMGEYASEAACLTWIQANLWDDAGTGSGDPRNGMFFYDTTVNYFKGYQGGSWKKLGETDHGSLNGLSDDDHSQYHNDSRGDARYYTQTQLDAGQLDSRYFAESEFLSSSAGAGDAGKPVKLDADGNIDASMINDGDIDHGSIGGLSDDDHTIYTLADGTRAFTGDQSMGSNKLTNVATPVSGTDAANKDYVDQQVQLGVEWQDSVIDKDLTAPPGGESEGDRYIVGSGASGAWSGHDDDIAEYNGSSYDFSTATEGMAVWVDDENRVYHYNGTAWVSGASIVNHNDLANKDGGTSGEYYHLTSAQHSEITTFFASTDISASEAETLTDSSDASSLHNHDSSYFTEAELGSSTADSEGASLIGTDTKANLNNATTVEVALTFINSQNPSKRSTNAGNPNGSVSGAVGDICVDTTNDIPYMNVDGTNAGWQVL